jgi:hypothetical protein
MMGAPIPPGQSQSGVTYAMRYADIQLGAKPYSTAYRSLGLEICENFYVENSTTETSKYPYYLVKIPGLRLHCPRIVETPCRGMYTSGTGRTFGAFGSNVYEIFSNGLRQVVGGLLTPSGLVKPSDPVSFCDNGTIMLVVDGYTGYTLDLTTNQWVTMDDTEATGSTYFPINPGPTHCACIDTYFIVNVPNTAEYLWSNPGYVLDSMGSFPLEYWNSLQSNKKIGYSDNILGLLSANNMLWLFGPESVEVHYDTGLTPGTWARYQGAIIECGTMARFSPARYQNNVFWLGTDTKTGTIGVFSNNGFQPIRISTRGIEQLIERGQDTSDAIGWCYAQGGHAFYVLSFPTANLTIVYDIVSQSWSRRTYWRTQDATTHRHRGIFHAFNWGKNLMGDTITDCVYSLDVTKGDNDDPTGVGTNVIACVKTTPLLFATGRNQRINEIQIICSQGVGLDTPDANGVGYDPKMLVSLSRDFGASWGNERDVRVGKIGEYSHRSREMMWGMGRNLVFRIRYTEPTPFLLVGMIVNAVPCSK